jgi:hypothetical protein
MPADCATAFTKTPARWPGFSDLGASDRDRDGVLAFTDGRQRGTDVRDGQSLAGLIAEYERTFDSPPGLAWVDWGHPAAT